MVSIIIYVLNSIQAKRPSFTHSLFDKRRERAERGVGEEWARAAERVGTARSRGSPWMNGMRGQWSNRTDG